ncbi:MAG: hypothetical protein KKD39_07830 [Candidatus Altiarchaeota archaeon]|nr:hypothetical protein [Candidatus Altiarchaeota archaeon]
MEDISPKKLAQSILEKHDRLIMEYSVEVDRAKQVNMLREKKDQLLHWVEENGSKDKYSKELTETEAELENLMGSFEIKSQNYYNDLEARVKDHMKAKEYWIEKIGELKT